MRVGILAEKDCEIFHWSKVSEMLTKRDIDPIYLVEKPVNRYKRKLTEFPAKILWRLVNRLLSSSETIGPERYVPQNRIQLDCHFSGHFKDFPPSAIDQLKSLNLDFIYRLGGRGIYRGDILSAARFGIISIHHGDPEKYRGGPPGFWEVMNGEPQTGFMIQQLTPTLDGGICLAVGEVTTDPDAATNRRNIYEAADSAAAEVLERIIEKGKVEQSFKPKMLGEIYKTPGMLVTLNYIIRRLWSGIGAKANQTPQNRSISR